jgi:hypothetical protein
MLIKPTKTRTLLLASLLAFVAVGCGSSLDDERLEDVISQGIQEQTGATVAQIDCPSGRPLQANDVFTCSGTTTDGQTFTVQVTQTDANGNVRWQLL